MSIYAPTIVEKTPEGRISYDIFSRLTKDRIVMAIGEVNDEMAASITAQLLFLAASDSNKEITMYINSPGGSVTAGMAIYDTMQMIPCDVRTVGMGLCASMGSVLLAGGTKGKRCLSRHAEVMIHQPSGGSKGQATDMEIVYKHIAQTKRTLTQLLADRCGKPYEKLHDDMERDYFMTSEEALRYGIVDEIIDEIGKPGTKISDLEEKTGLEKNDLESKTECNTGKGETECH